MVWKVERNSGARAGLIAEGLWKQVWRPLTMSKEEFYQWLPEGFEIHDQTIEKVLKIWG
jgi:hypothetical protein